MSAAIESPSSLFLVWLPAFDLVRTGGHPPVLRINDAGLKVGKLPGEGLHRWRLIKYAHRSCRSRCCPARGQTAPQTPGRRALPATVPPRPWWAASRSDWRSARPRRT